jgi:outer membrane lipoprotein-sorting protein
LSAAHPDPAQATFTPSAPLRQLIARGDAQGAAMPYIAGMTMLRALLAPIALLALSAPAFAEKIALGDLSAYLNKLSTVQSDFTQVNSDGTVSLGKIFIKRPGRVRFEYAPPDKSLVLASADTVAIFDSKSNQPPEEYPLKRTPLSLILAPEIDLARAKMVVGHTEVENTTRVLAQDPAHPEYGTIELVFTADPIALRQWVITDDLGQQTTVILGELTPVSNLAGSLFNIVEEKNRRSQRD